MADPTPNKTLLSKRQFLLKNMLRGLFWLMAIVGGYVIAQQYFNFTLESVLGSVYDEPIVVYSIFLASEVIFGIIPPEFFMIWSLRTGEISLYAQNITTLAIMSYVAGVIGFFIGQYLSNTLFYIQTKNRVFGKFEQYLHYYGGFLVVVAAITPIPFSGIAMLVGSIKYSLRSYLLFSLFRFARFLVYSIIIYKANML